MTTRSPRNAKAAPSKKPFDLDAVEAEAAGEPFEFTFHGRSYALPHVKDVDRKILLAADQGEKAAMDALLKLSLGEEFEEFNAHPMKLRSVEALFGAWLEHCGLEPGELRASTRS